MYVQHSKTKNKGNALQTGTCGHALVATMPKASKAEFRNRQPKPQTLSREAFGRLLTVGYVPSFRSVHMPCEITTTGAAPAGVASHIVLVKRLHT